MSISVSIGVGITALRGGLGAPPLPSDAEIAAAYTAYFELDGADYKLRLALDQSFFGDPPAGYRYAITTPTLSTNPTETLAATIEYAYLDDTGLLVTDWVFRSNQPFDLADVVYWKIALVRTSTEAAVSWSGPLSTTVTAASTVSFDASTQNLVADLDDTGATTIRVIITEPEEYAGTYDVTISSAETAPQVMKAAELVGARAWAEDISVQPALWLSHADDPITGDATYAWEFAGAATSDTTRAVTQFGLLPYQTAQATETRSTVGLVDVTSTTALEAAGTAPTTVLSNFTDYMVVRADYPTYLYQASNRTDPVRVSGHTVGWWGSLGNKAPLGQRTLAQRPVWTAPFDGQPYINIDAGAAGGSDDGKWLQAQTSETEGSGVFDSQLQTGTTDRIDGLLNVVPSKFIFMCAWQSDAITYSSNPRLGYLCTTTGDIFYFSPPKGTGGDYTTPAIFVRASDGATSGVNFASGLDDRTTPACVVVYVDMDAGEVYFRAADGSSDYSDGGSPDTSLPGSDTLSVGTGTAPNNKAKRFATIDINNLNVIDFNRTVTGKLFAMGFATVGATAPTSSQLDALLVEMKQAAGITS